MTAPVRRPGSLAYFTRSDDSRGESLVPEPHARSLWSDDQIHGVALAGALGRGAEAAMSREDLQPVRLTVDLFRPARMAPCEVEAEIVREGRRLSLVDVLLSQDGTPTARASALFLRPSQEPEGEVWAPGERFDPPPADLAPAPPPGRTADPHPPYFASDGHWTADFADHQDSFRKMSWSPAMPIVVGEALTPFQAAASVADGASLVTNWGDRGIEHINTDLSLQLVRPPRGTEIGLAGLDRVTCDGLVSGVAAVFDRDGRCGTVSVTAMGNTRRTVDLGSVRYDVDGTRSV